MESIKAAFDMGATIVEIDIRRTKDNKLMIFHDYMLECRTNGKGHINTHTSKYLKTLDIGYGYTYDDGKTYPLRGKGIGKMPELMEVLKVFTNRQFLIDHKDGDMQSMIILVNTLKKIPEAQRKLIYYWGPDKTYEYLQKELPEVKRFLVTRKQMKKWLKKYLFSFGLTNFPDEAKGVVLAMPPKYTKILWGWPYRFLKKVKDAKAEFYLIVDSEEDAKKYRDYPIDGIITDYIEITGNYYKN